jgi:peptidoglycan/LPS O-acetylase OafA/YrhL
MNNENTLGKVRYIASFDGMRMLCITAVIAFHVISSDRPWLNNVARRGWCGVDVFFVLSGFLITWIIASELDNTETVNLKRFYVRRALRLQPAYFSGLLGFALLLFVFNRTHFEDVAHAFPFFLTYTLNFAIALGFIGFPPYGQAWSLCIEEHFYLGWPWALRRFGTHRCFRIALALITIVLIWRTCLYLSLNWAHPWVPSPQSLDRIYYGTDTRIDSILFGCVAGLAMRESALQGLFGWIRQWRWLTTAAGVISLITFIWATAGEKGGWRAATVGFSLMAATSALLTVALFLQRESLLSRALSWSPLVFVGRISYGIYLFHGPVWHLVARVMHLSSGAVGTLPQELAAFSIVFAATVAIAWLHYQMVEQRFLALRDRFTFDPIHRGERPIPAAAPASAAPTSS